MSAFEEDYNYPTGDIPGKGKDPAMRVTKVEPKKKKKTTKIMSVDEIKKKLAEKAASK